MAKAPGQAHRKGVTLMESLRKFDIEEKAEDWFVSVRWSDGIQCPRCESKSISKRENRKPMPFHCKSCRKYFSVRTNTPLQHSNLPLSKWAIAIYLSLTNLKGVSSMKLHRDLGITQKNAWHLAHLPTFSGG